MGKYNILQTEKQDLTMIYLTKSGNHSRNLNCPLKLKVLKMLLKSVQLNVLYMIKSLIKVYDEGRTLLLK